MYNKYAELRDQRGLTDYAVAKQSGISRTVLSDWGMGKHTPSAPNIDKLASFFHVPLSYFYGETKGEIYSITRDEFAIICAYRDLPVHKQEAILDILHIEMDVVGEKNVKEA